MITKHILFRRWILALLLTPFMAATYNARAAADAESSMPPKMIFAHYMVCFRNSVEFYKREIELAQRSGIDGFALNCGAWLIDPKSDKLDSSCYVESATRIYQAAQELNTGFRLFLSPDLATLKSGPANIEDMVKRFAHHPAQFRHQGKIVLSSYSGTPEFFAPILQQIKNDGLDVFFVPGLGGKPYSANWSPRKIRSLLHGQEQLDGVFFFGPDMTAAEYLRTNAALCRTAAEFGKLYMAGISPAYNSPNLRDFYGMRGYEAKWRGVIQDGAPWVEIVTWNDYNEDSHLMPYRWDAKPLGGRQYFSHDEAYLDATLYYATWFKTGNRPEIVQDKLYAVYRNRPKDLTAAWNAKTQTWEDLTKTGKAIDQIHDDVEDQVYVTAFLTKPATLQVSLGGKDQRMDMPAGVSHMAVPMSPGVPRFQLTRGRKKVIEIDGGRSIVGKPTPENSAVGYHLANRSWTCGAVAGKAVRLPGRPGQLIGVPAQSKDEGGRSLEAAKEWEAPVSIPATSRYNIRIVYRNSGSEDARLTLLADGSAPGPTPKPENYFPVHFPPTAGKTATVSILWSLYGTTTRLKLASLPAPENNEHPWESDRGSITIDEIQLVPVEPAVAAKANDAMVPEQVLVPGGTFKMGSEQGAPDEKPVHAVNVASFWLGKYEITNAQYEHYDPAHRQLRDEYSWRDSDPVIYVSWEDAARYCNWLSRRVGLAPYYDETTWEANPKANGFRLPTEAEWEYEASGRGEGRIYPWGKAQPRPALGNFSAKASLDVETALRGQGNIGTVPVGSYPQGASRDGIMDLAGNVAEWCFDYYEPYSKPVAGAPLPDKARKPRSIRGGSWGYYNLSQRVTDREFNNQRYGGYVYIGFRISRSEDTQK